MIPKIGMQCLYRQRPGQIRQGQQDLPATITRVNSDGTVTLRIVIPDSVDVIIEPKIKPLSQELSYHCWLVPDYMMGGGNGSERIESLQREIAELQERVDALENKRGAGRPPKASLLETAATFKG